MMDKTITGVILLLSLLLLVEAKPKYNCCPGKIPECPANDPKMAVLLPHSTNCEWYFECSNGIAYCMPCPAGEYFNPKLKVCDYPENSGCVNANPLEAGSEYVSCAGIASGSDPEPVPDSETNDDSGEDVPTGPETENKNVCPATEAPACPAQDPKKAILLPHPTSCEWYYECSNGIPYCMPCPSGEYFNPKLKVCDYPENSGCGVAGGSDTVAVPESETNDESGEDVPTGPENKNKNVCPATEAPACPAQDPKMAVLLPHPTSCEWYYECSNGIPYCMPCPAGEYFNPKLKVCDYPENSGCGVAGGSDPGPETDDGPKTDNVPPETDTGNKNVCPATEAPACPAQDPKMAVLLPHPTSCEWYYECSNGIPYCMPCPAGEYFNPKLKVCDYPENSGCGVAGGSDPGPGTDDGPKTDNVPPETDNANKNVCPATEAPACPAQDPKMAVLLPHPTSCEWYYECSNGIPYCMPCPAGEYFNPKLKVCDYPENSGCGVAGGSDPGPGTDNGPKTDNVPPETETGNKNGCPATEAPACPAQDPKMAVLLPHPTSCEWYYECSNGIPYCMPCPAGEYFNPKLKVCDYPQNSGCGVAGGSDPGPGTDDGPKTDNVPPETDNANKNVCPATEAPACPAQDPKMAVLLPHPTSCEWYYECSNGIPYCMPCPAGEYFNPKLKVCDYPENSGCGVAGGSDPGPGTDDGPKTDNVPPETETGNKNVCPATEAPACPAQDPKMAVLLPHPTSCEWYYECSNGIPYCMPCPAGEYFNPKLKVCDYPENSGCGVAGGSDPGPETDDGSKTDNVPSETDTGNKNVCPATEAPACPAQDPKMAVLLPHPTSCEWYYECSNGIPYCMPCPAGEYFNPKLKVCDYPENSGCGVAGGSDPGPGTDDGPKTGNVPSKTDTGNKNVCPVTEVPACPAQDPKMAVLLPHPTSCEWYYECSNGIPYCMPCPAGEYFNPKLKVCDYPENSGCGVAGGSDPGPGTDDGPKTGNVPSKTDTGNKNVCPVTEAPACPAQDPKMAVLLHHPTSCEWYYECSNGIPYCMPCPAGEYFNPKLKVCDYKEDSGCNVAN